MTYLIAGLVLFLGLHSLRMLAPLWRLRMLASLGETKWKGVYSLLSLLGFVLLCWGFGLARQQPVVVWLPATAMRHVAALLMLASWVLMAAAFVPRNRLKSRLGHPMVLSVKVWALAHLMANGNLADVLLFGSFLFWSVCCFISLRRRDRVAATVYPQGKWWPTAATLVLGVLAWTVFAFHLHQPLIGVAVIGR